jgi:hypothetical protein
MEDKIQRILEGEDVYAVLEAKAPTAKSASTAAFKALQTLRTASKPDGLGKVPYTSGKVKRALPTAADISKAIAGAVGADNADKIAADILAEIQTKGKYNGLSYFWNSVLGDLDMDTELKLLQGSEDKDKATAELNNLQSKVDDEAGNMKGAIKDSKKLISTIIAKYIK